MLLLEDDACATSELELSTNVLEQLANDTTWDIARLGHCFDKTETHKPRCLRSYPDGTEKGLRMAHHASALWNTTELTPADGPQQRSTQVLSGIGRSFCAHALAVTRRGAEQLLRVAFPVSSYFDDVLYALAGGYGETAQQVALKRARVTELQAVHTSTSLFAQRSKDGSMSTLIHVHDDEL